MPFDGKTYRAASPEIADRLEKMDKVIALLDRPEKWCKGVTVSRSGAHCILGAVNVADGVDELVPIIAKTISRLAPRDRVSVSRLDKTKIAYFNDYCDTKHGDVLLILHAARERVASPSLFSRVLHRAREIIVEGRR